MTANAPQIYILDSTLRLGESALGVSFSKEQKLHLVRLLARLGVDALDIGFPAASTADFEIAKIISQEIKDRTLSAYARPTEKEFERAAEALKSATHSRLHFSLPTQAQLIEKRLKINPQDLIAFAKQYSQLARQLVTEVELSIEDAFTASTEMLCPLIEAVIEQGVQTITLIDSHGDMLPHIFVEKIDSLQQKIPNADKASWGVVCANTYGLAQANAATAFNSKKIRQVTTSLKGLAERAGINATEEILMLSRSQPESFTFASQIDVKHLNSCLHALEQITGNFDSLHKPVTGIDVTEEPSTSVQRNQLNKLSGRNAFRERLSQLGWTIESEGELNTLFTRFKDLADRKQTVYDKDLLTLVATEQERFQFIALRQTVETGEPPYTWITFLDAGKEIQQEASGNGPLDSLCRAIESHVKSNAELTLYRSQTITPGTQAQLQVSIRLTKGGRVFSGVGIDIDLVVASAKAYLAALNRLFAKSKKIQPQDPI